MQSPNMLPNQQLVMQVQPVMVAAGQAANPRLSRYKKTMRGLGYSELVIGLICSILGICVLSNAYGVAHYRRYYDYYSETEEYYYTHFDNLGEGLWCGVWIIIAGSVGIACGKKTLTRSLLNCNITFSILGSLFSALMFSLAVTFSIIYTFDRGRHYPFGVGIEATLAALSCVSLTLCISSASISCCAVSSVGGGGCGSCCGDEQVSTGGGQVVYVMPQGMVAGEGSAAAQAQQLTLQNRVGSLTPPGTPQPQQYAPAPQQQPQQPLEANQVHHQDKRASYDMFAGSTAPPSYHA